MSVLITAKKDGFRRCGMAHSSDAVKHPDGTFTAEELEILKAEPMLVVQELDDVPADPLATMIKKDLITLLTAREVAFDPKAEKKDLLALARALPPESESKGE